jgi:hypothetical protein
MSPITVSIAVDEAHQAQIVEVAAALQAQGLKVEQTMPTIGVITGTVDSSQINGLSQVAGVIAVEQEQGVQLPPPEADIQ